MKINKIYAITPDINGWRVLPTGERLKLGDEVTLGGSLLENCMNTTNTSFEKLAQMKEVTTSIEIITTLCGPEAAPTVRRLLDLMLKMAWNGGYKSALLEMLKTVDVAHNSPVEELL